MNKRIMPLAVAAAITASLAGCKPTDIRTTSDIHSAEVAAELSDTLKQSTPYSQSSPSVYVQKDGVYVDAEPMSDKRKHWWLKSKRLGKFEARPASPIPLSEVLTWLASQGLNISAPVPGLENLTYRGYALNTDAYSALQAITATAGVDFIVDDSSRAITIVPMAAKRYQVFLSDRKASYKSGSALTAASAIEGTEDGSDSSSSTGGSSTGGGSSSTIETSSEFWAALKSDLEAQCEVLTRSSAPVLSLSPMGDFPQGVQPPAAGSINSSNGESTYSTSTWCKVSINPVAGFVTVQAPAWMQKQFSDYIDSINRRLTTGLTFDARIYMLSTNSADSKGVDLSAFAKFANGYQLSVVNNAVGGITVSPGSAARPSSNSIAGASIGLTRDAQSVFLNYLQSIGNTTIKRRPIVHTSCGTPVTIADLEEEMYQLQNQQATGGENAVVATSREIVTRDVGFSIQLSPTCDPDRQLIRAPFDFLQATKTGEQLFAETLTTANGVVENTIRIPKIKRNQLTGELLIPYGGTIIIGGLQAQTNSSEESGITGLRKSSLGDLFGSGRVDMTTSQVFLVLTAKVSDYGQ